MGDDRAFEIDLSAIDDWAMTCDRAGRIIWTNRPDTETHTHVRDWLGEGADRLLDPAGLAPQGGVLVRVREPDNCDRWFSWRSVPTKGDQLLLLGRDVTDEHIDRKISGAERTILRRLVDGDGLRVLIGVACDALEDLVDGAMCSVVIADHARSTMHPIGGESLPRAFLRAIDGVTIDACTGTCGKAIATGTEAVTEDITTDPNWVAYAELAATHGLRACWSLPLRGPDRVLGSFAVYRREPHVPTAREREVAARLVDVVTATIQHRTAEEAARRSREKAEAADIAKSAFLAQVSHELRTPLNAVVGFADAMEQGIWGPLGDQRYKDYAASIRQAGVHLVGLVNQIVDLSTAESGERHLTPSRIGLGDMIGEAWTLASNARPRAKVQMTMAPEVADVDLTVDPEALRQMLINILGNAVKFTPNGRSIRVETRLTGDERWVTVRDEGVGIGPPTLARLRAGQFPAHSATVATGQGAGLGLRITRFLAELHGGRLDVDVDPGGGAAVSIVLPAWRDAGP